MLSFVVNGEDFMSDKSLTISLSASDFGEEVCMSIPTVIDTIVEGVESFNVSLVSTGVLIPTISLHPNIPVEVFIIDNSGELTTNVCMQ